MVLKFVKIHHPQYKLSGTLYKAYLSTIILLNTLKDIKSYPSRELGRKSQKVAPFNHRLYLFIRTSKKLIYFSTPNDNDKNE